MQVLGPYDHVHVRDSMLSGVLCCLRVAMEAERFLYVG